MYYLLWCSAPIAVARRIVSRLSLPLNGRPGTSRTPHPRHCHWQSQIYDEGCDLNLPPADTHGGKAARLPATFLQNLPFQKLFEPISKDLKPPGKMPAMRIEQIHRHRCGPMSGHHLDEFAGVEMMVDVVGRDLDQAKAGEAAGDIGFRAVDSNAATNRHHPHLAILNPFPILDAASRGRGIVDDEVRAEFVRGAKRAMFGKISGAGNIDQGQVSDLAGNETGITQGTDPQYTVDALLDEVDRTVGDTL